MKTKILAILPAYNEEKNLSYVIKDIKSQKLGIDILVVDDGSIDKTSLVAKKNRTFVIRHPFNLGIGATVQTGFKYAVKNNYDIALQIDSDGQHPANQIKKIIEPLLKNQADAVIGSRFLKKSGFKMPLSRKVGVSIFRMVNSILIKNRITDNTSGFRGYNKKSLALLSLHYPWDFPEPEAIIILARNNLRIKEVPVTMKERYSGVSTVYNTILKSIYYMAKVLVAILASRYRAPVIKDI